MTKLLLLDLDGTIRCSTTGNFIESPKGQKPMLGADRAIKHFYNNGWLMAGVSNQGGITAGYKTLENTIEEMQYTLELFPQLECIFFCPDFEGRRCVIVWKDRIFKYSLDDEHGYKKAENYTNEVNFRKPGTGMLLAAIEMLTRLTVKYFLTLTEVNNNYDCWMIGDRNEDREAAENLKINYLDAETWRKRFLPGMHQFNNVTLAQLQFLEGVEL